MIEDAIVITWIDALSEVTHIQLYMSCVLLTGTDDYPCMIRRITDGVREEIGEHPRYLLTVDKEFRDAVVLRVFNFYGYIELICLHTIGLDGIVYQFDRLRNTWLKL